MDSKLQSVLEKVAKLRALAARATTQAEAEAAAAQAEALIAKYQIDEAQLASENPERDEPMNDEQEPLYRNPSSYAQKWLGMLASGVAKIHGCFVWERTHFATEDTRIGRTVDIRIVGKPSDVAIVRYMFAWLHSEIVRLSKAEHGKGGQNAFRIGATIGVLRAMRASQASEMRAADAASPSHASQANGGGSAMILVNRASMAKQFAESVVGKFSANSGPRTTDHSGAMARGVKAGSNLAPKPGLGAANGPRMLGK